MQVLSISQGGKSPGMVMKAYSAFIFVAIISLIAALVWAQQASLPADRSSAVHVASSRMTRSWPQSSPTDSTTAMMSPPPLEQPIPAALAAEAGIPRSKHQSGDSLPDSSSSLPLLAVLGFGVLAGGITSALRTHR